MGEAGSAKKSQYQVINPPSTLHRRVAVKGDGAIDFDAVKRAETALEKLAVQFDGWMADETGRLLAARADFVASKGAKEAANVLFRAAHDIKGQATTLGYPLASSIAASLCRLLEHVDHRRLPQLLVDQHVDAVRAVVDEVGKNAKSVKAETLCRRLVEVTMDFIEQEKQRAANSGEPPISG